MGDCSSENIDGLDIELARRIDGVGRRLALRLCTNPWQASLNLSQSRDRGTYLSKNSPHQWTEEHIMPSAFTVILLVFVSLSTLHLIRSIAREASARLKAGPVRFRPSALARRDRGVSASR